MKKVIKILIFTLVALAVPNVQARVLDADYFPTLNVSYAYVCGNYMFNVGSGFRPSLQDFMIASRTIENPDPTTHYDNTELYVIFYDSDDNSYEINKTFAGGDSLGASFLGNLKPAYLYRNHIKDSNPEKNLDE